MRRIRLTEYQKTAEPIRLSVAERDAIAEGIPSLTIEPATGQDGHYFLSPSSTIGALELESLAVEIGPKLPIDRVLFLISYALDPKKWRDVGFNFDEADSLVEAIVPAFATHIRRAFRRGILQGYRTIEESAATVRGQIRFSDQIRDRYGIFPPIEVRYDEFTEDILENQLIKAALEVLCRKRIRSAYARRELRSFDAVLQNVSLVPFDRRHLPEIQYSRLNDRYRAAVELAKLILRSSSFELREGKSRATSFLVDMNQVFEDFVVTALREELGLSVRQFPQNALGKRLRLDAAGEISLEPDISWWEANRCCFVGDVKYKPVNAAGIKHPDLYQLLSYTIAARVPEGLLIYAAGGPEPRVHDIDLAGKKLSVTALDLAGTPKDILEQIRTAAMQVRHQRVVAIRQRLPSAAG